MKMKFSRLRTYAVLAFVLLFAGTPLLRPALARTIRPVWTGQQAPTTPALPKGIERVTSVEGITEYRLANGLRVLLFPDQTKQTITVNMTYLVGSGYENYGETGMAHLLEHMVFKGTPRHPNIPQELTEHGARPNGSTSFDRTNYFETFASSDVNLEWALDLESDRMINSYIARKALDSEFSVVRNEFEMGENSPFRVIIDKGLASAYQWHNYGKTTIGARSDIENVDIDRLQAYYRLYYQPDNTLLMVAGKFDEAKTLNLIDKYFSPIPRPARALPKVYTVEPTQDGERAVTVRRVGDIQIAAPFYHVPAGTHPDFAAIDILGQILGDTPSGRLYKALVETRKATQVLNHSFQQREPGISIFGAIVAKDIALEPARDGLLQVVENFTDNPPTKEEVERARTSLIKDIDLALNSSENIGLQMSEWAAMGDWRLFFLHRDRLKKVTPEDVQRVAAKYLKASNRTLGIFVPTAKPERSEIPATPDVAAMLKDYKGEAAVASGEAFDPSPANIEAKTTRNSAGVFKVALLPKKTRGNAVFAQITLRFGDEKSLLNRSPAGDMAGALLMRGTAKHTRQQIQDELDKLKARAFVSGGATQASASIETTRENLPAVLRLVAEILREPAFPTSELELLKQESITGLQSQQSEPTAIAQLAFRRHLNPFPKGDVRYVSTLDESIANVKSTTIEDAKKFYSDFYGASNGELAVVGDFDDQEIVKLAGELFGNWKSPRPFARIEGKYNDAAPLLQAFETPDKANAFFIAGLNLKMRDDDPDYPALVLGNYMLGGGFLNSRLATRLRQKEGLSYNVGSQFGASPLDQTGSFQAVAIYAPQNVARLETAFNEEIARALKDGFTAEEVAAAKSGYLQSRQVNRAQDAGLSRTLASYLFWGRTFGWDAEFEKRISALTSDQITAAMRRHIDPAKLTIVKAGDFAKAVQKVPSQ
jgi:zinc protease